MYADVPGRQQGRAMPRSDSRPRGRGDNYRGDVRGANFGGGGGYGDAPAAQGGGDG